MGANQFTAKSLHRRPCPRCDGEHFRAVSKTGQIQPYCRSCQHNYHQDNLEHRRVIIKKHTAKAYARSKKIMDEAKSVPCLDCGETFPICCMDFHHVDPKTKYKRKTKNGGMGMIRLADLSEATLRAEIAKCVVICSNCHRIRTDVRYDKAFNA